MRNSLIYTTTKLSHRLRESRKVFFKIFRKLKIIVFKFSRNKKYYWQWSVNHCYITVWNLLSQYQNVNSFCRWVTENSLETGDWWVNVHTVMTYYLLPIRIKHFQVISSNRLRIGRDFLDVIYYSYRFIILSICIQWHIFYVFRELKSLYTIVCYPSWKSLKRDQVKCIHHYWIYTFEVCFFSYCFKHWNECEFNLSFKFVISS